MRERLAVYGICRFQTGNWIVRGRYVRCMYVGQSVCNVEQAR